MRNLYKIVVLLMLVALPLAACSPASDAAPAEEVVEEVVTDAAPVEEVTDAAPAEEETEEEVVAPEVEEGFSWDQDYISEVPPIMMMDPYFQIFGQSQEPVPYYYEDAVKLAGLPHPEDIRDKAGIKYSWGCSITAAIQFLQPEDKHPSKYCAHWQPR